MGSPGLPNKSETNITEIARLGPNRGNQYRFVPRVYGLFRPLCAACALAGLGTARGCCVLTHSRLQMLVDARRVYKQRRCGSGGERYCTMVGELLRLGAVDGSEARSPRGLDACRLRDPGRSGALSVTGGGEGASSPGAVPSCSGAAHVAELRQRVPWRTSATRHGGGAAVSRERQPLRDPNKTGIAPRLLASAAGAKAVLLGTLRRTTFKVGGMILPGKGSERGSRLAAEGAAPGYCGGHLPGTTPEEGPWPWKQCSSALRRKAR